MSFSMEKYFVALAAIRELRAALASITEDVLRISSDDMTNEQVNLVLDIIDTHTSNFSAHSAFSGGTIRLWDPATGDCSSHH